MNRRHHMVELTGRLAAASAAADWPALASIDRELTVLLPELAKQGVRSTAERAAMSALRQAHRASQQRCGEATERLSERLAELRARKEGWLAYAMDEHLEGAAP